ncbi:protein mono-ADP-ribosyltransferase PARP14-like isoform X2 [Neopsephotus bourkii]|uniref:protein mono-ADP-ribosyltransferase PARP14-like isoform X2 n=1 Tax=Neopsephotus bourkii TaxID=309878 RepID=UPI002AA51224|nr:protein mono-ADP-ribosyltransferase PARP14-like isoform X2 [Neopsephotus bourkii]
MAGQRPGGFPLLVRGDWGSAEPPRALRRTLLRYFQSQKRSGGGECELRAGTATGHLLVCFLHPEVKQRVLERQSHELYLGEKGRVKLVVTEPDTALAAEEEAFEEKLSPKKALDATSNLQRQDDAEALQKAESFVASGELQEEAGSAANIAEKPRETSPSVVFENIQERSPECLRLLLESISGLAADDDFTMEVIPEINVAVATFPKSIDTEELVKKCSQNRRVKEFQMTARLLELTRSIKAENIPASVSTDYITVYFESARNGGGTVSDVQFFPEESLAIITFCDHKDVNAVLEKQHFLEQTPISVHPYYHSLGTALYGEERPTVKMPDPIGMPLDPYVWQFLQRQAKLMQDINQEMAICHCELKWPQTDCAHPEIMLCPSSSLSEQKKPMINLIKTWKQDASTEFSRIMARYVAIKCKVNSAGWKGLKNRLVKNVALIITEISEETVVIAGNRAAVDSAEKEVRECMEKAAKQSEREKQSIEISVSVIPGQYAVLHNAGLEENIHKEYPCLKIFYDDTQKTVQLRGLPAEVSKVKADLLEKVLNMSCTSVTIDPHVLYYLQRADNKKVSETLFTSRKINSFYELGADTVMLFGDAPKDLSEAEKQIKTGLEYKCISVEDCEVIKKEQWKSLLASLCSSQETVVIDEPGKENKVIIAGFSKDVAEVYQKLTDFIDRNTHMEKVIPAKSVVVVQFVEQEKSNVYLKLKKKGMTIHFDTKTPCISVSGPRADVQNAVTTFEKILSSLYLKTVQIDKPGAKELFIERKESCVFEAKQKFGCLIRLEEEEQHQQEKMGGKVGDTQESKLYFKKMLPDGVVVAVYKDDLCTHPVDVVVNASNEDLKHKGGVAWALLEAAGPEIQEECDELVKKSGSLQPGCVVITGAGKLPCKNIIHAVGPRWRKDEAEQCVCLLRQTVKRSLQLAETFHHRSIALPTISGGIFGFPLELCTYSIVASIKETLKEAKGDISLKEIHLVDDTEGAVQALSEAVKKVFAAELSSPILQTSSSGKLNLRESQKEEEKGDLLVVGDHLQMVTTNEGLCIQVEEKNVQEATTDVIVNSVGTDLKFGVGPLCKALLKKAGPGLQAEFDNEKQREVADKGSVLCTSGCSLACKTVLHAIIPMWNQGRGQTVETLEDIITSCLKKTEELGMKSITFPAIGTGGFRFPKSIVSKLMFDVVFKFSSSHSQRSLQEVHFVLNPKDVDNIQAFNMELQRRVAESCSAAASWSSIIRPVSADTLGVHEMQIGSITLQVTTGDITEEDTEVIVNISNPTFDATSGVFSAIMAAAGSQVEAECAQYAGQFQSGFITTQGGKLLCSKIIHLIHNRNVNSQVSKVLNECELRMYRSVAFPAIGTGQAGQSPAKVADDMLDAIVEFANKRSVQHLQKIKIVIFQTNMLKDFYKSMKKREDSNSSTINSSFFQVKKQPNGKKKIVDLEKKIDLATFQICGESQTNVDKTESWLKDLILKDHFENIISDELIEHFDQRQIDTLKDLQSRKHVTIQFENKVFPPCIKISGITKDVCWVSMEVQKIIQNLKDTEEERSKAELVYNLVEWRYPGSNDSFVAFDKITNMQLEDAKIAKKPHLTVKINGKNYKVDMNTLQANDDQGKTINIQRVSKNEDKQPITLPSHWEDMENKQVKVVNLKPFSEEYLKVQSRFKKGCGSCVIEKIERIQNPLLWQTYQIKKLSVCAKNKNKNNEKFLFHGTAASSLNTINYNGFDRGYAGKNAATIGNGTYFAVDACYSAQDIYSRPDANGRKYMYLVRVLTGQYCVGSKGLIKPPAKNTEDSSDVYDSVVDNVKDPTMFVIFSDIQAYPEYLITFRC